MVDEQVSDQFWWHKPHVDGNSSATILLKPQSAPSQNAGTIRAEQDLESGISLTGTGIG
jgi:hypothetical protein